MRQFSSWRVPLNPGIVIILIIVFMLIVHGTSLLPSIYRWADVTVNVFGELPVMSVMLINVSHKRIQAREARRNQSTAEIKEIRFRLKIDDHDFEVKKGHVVRFLNGGDKVKVTIMLRGREQSRPIGGVELLQRLAQEVEEYGTVEFAPKQEGRNIIMTLAPKGKKVHTQSEQRRRGDQSRAERQARQAARLAAKQEAQAQAAAEAKAAVASDKPKTSETK